MSGDARARLIAKLSEPQRDVVAQRGRGPIKVSAAAGSGKTTTMATLYALEIVDGTPPSRILAVTFTERAATELRERIGTTLAGVGWSESEGVTTSLEGAWIGTFHHIARRLLAEHSYLAEVPRDLRTLDDVESRMQLETSARQVRQALPRDPDFKRLFSLGMQPRGLLALMDGVVDAVARVRSTDLAPADCRRLSESAYARFAEAGDPEVELRWHRLAMAVTVAVWEDYEAGLTAQRCTDFDGLLRAALSALRQRPALAQWCHSNFELLIVDEFQDTSAVQNSLLEVLVGDGLKKLYVVGDARQSIFAFRDAKPGIMAAAPGRSLRLFRNHRSLWPILAAADHVIQADEQFAADGAMEVDREEPGAHPVLLGLAPDPSQEAEGIAEFLELVHRHGLPGPEGSVVQVGYHSMAVLAYTFSKIGQPLEEALRRRGIPFQTATGGLLSRPEIKDAVALLRVIADDSEDAAWIRVLQSPWIRVGDADMLHLSRSSAGTRASLRQRIEVGLGADGVGPALADRVARLFAAVDDLRELSRRRPAPQVVSEALSRSGMRAYHEARALLQTDDGERALAALRDLQRLALGAQPSGSWLSLAGLLETIDAMAAASGRAEPPPRSDRQLVTLSTIHRAKGLEWPVVVLADCRPHHQRGRPAVVWDRSEQAVVMPRIVGTETGAGARWKRSADARVAAEEHRRLVYVAMTRARDLLLVTTSRSGVPAQADSLEGLVGQLWGGAKGSGEFVELARALAAQEEWIGALPGFPTAVGLPWPAGPTLGTPARESGDLRPTPPTTVLRARWAELADLDPPGRLPSPRPPEQLSFSGLRMLERCPRQYWFGHIARFHDPRGHQWAPEGVDPDEVPGARARELGTLVHAVLERGHRAHPGSAPSSAEIGFWLKRLGEGTGASGLAEASTLLHGYLQMAVADLPTVGTEVPFSWRNWAGPGVPPLDGVIDRIAETTEGTRLVIDYKTNRSLTAVQLEAYSHQLRLYAMALDAAAKARFGLTKAAIVLLRPRELLPIDCGIEAREATLNWATALALQVVRESSFSGQAHPDRPCAECPFMSFCPDRRSAQISESS